MVFPMVLSAVARWRCSTKSIADFLAGGHGGVSEGDPIVAFPGAGGADEAQVRCLTDPVECDQIVVGGLRD